eukprot:tig00020800_g13748.t1
MASTHAELDFDRYSRVHVLIQRTVLGVDARDFARACARAKRDWEIDRQGSPRGGVPREGFYASLVQIAMIQVKTYGEPDREPGTEGAAPAASSSPAATAARCRAYLAALLEALTDSSSGPRRLRLCSEVRGQEREALAAAAAAGSPRLRPRPATAAASGADREPPIGYRRRPQSTASLEGRTAAPASAPEAAAAGPSAADPADAPASPASGAAAGERGPGRPQSASPSSSGPSPSASSRLARVAIHNRYATALGPGGSQSPRS